MNATQQKELRDLGYSYLREIPGQGICGIMHLLFTKGLACGINPDPLAIPYRYRYCYHTLMEALEALNHWDGEDHPPGNWIKRKGGFEGDFRRGFRHYRHSR